MGVLFLLRKDAAQNRRHSEGREDAGSEPGTVDFFRSSAPGELIAPGDVATQRGKCAGCLRVDADLAGSNGSTRAVPQVISQKNQAVRIIERKRP